MDESKVKLLEKLRQDYYTVMESQQSSELYPGFSKRLNSLIDKTVGLDIPSMNDRGRMAYIHKLTGHSKPAVSDWLQKDILPRDQSLRGLLIFLLSHIPGHYKTTTIEAWLRYGEDVITNPFATLPSNQNETMLKPIAASLVAKAGREMNMPVSSYDLQAAVNDVVMMLTEYGVQDSDDLQNPMEDLVKYYVAQHRR